ncbi:hypothetical protein J7E45_03730 [Microbacterium sp. ISL-59]|uniref:hypothetical protein n=1 Tax=Microbacterium sp. ISL-59 TaxID=2819159 RepID=UPI001BE89FA8|nr:hypothetical protein [Microbacterium sp. ISL-59]MBT2494708.1 hypothetical protein [Microbacterium sp. ISL-59]
MPQNSFGVHLSYTSVDRGDGTDPRDAAHDVLARLRVLAGVRDATAAWDDHEEAVLAIAVTDDGHVLTLSEQDTIESTLSASELKAAFEEKGLTLWLDEDVDEAFGFDSVEELVDELIDDSVEVGADDSEDAAIDSALFAASAVQVSAFSHRGPAIARMLAAVHGTAVDHREPGDWSLQRFETSEPSGAWVSSKAELPVIELNRADAAVWFEVAVGSGGPIPFWTEAERDTRPVLDIDAIRVPETAEIYRRLLTEGDGSRDELLEIAAAVDLDVDAAHRALIPEALGGVVGAEDRQRAFLAAFGISSDLIDTAFGSATTGADRRFLPVGWWPTLRETAIAGLGELTPLTRRERPLARIGDALRRRPAAGLLLSVGELGAGLWVASRSRGAGRTLGVLLVVDAVVDAAIWVTRIRRSRGE